MAADGGPLTTWREKDLLRFLTCGSVDDGKSTLIGRLLYDCSLILEDQLAALEQDSRRFGTTGADVDFSLLLDGLEDERQQRITIDVAYRFFATRERAFAVADTPGHEQYTRNMATGASTCELAVILVDARKGVLPQTKRHAFISSLLGIRHIVLAVNKMDLVGFDEHCLTRSPPIFRPSQQASATRRSVSSLLRRDLVTTSPSGRCGCRGTTDRPCSSTSIRSR
jgi:bifunctional enzyme CysN/CysC